MSIVSSINGFWSKLWKSEPFRQTVAFLVLTGAVVVMFFMAITEWEGFAALTIALGRVIIVASVWLLVDRFLIHPTTDTRNEIEQGNMAVALFAGMVFLGICLVVANS